MKFSPAQKICAIVLSAVSMFALVGLIPSPQVSGASTPAHRAKWYQIPQQYKTTGPGISYPDATDPTRQLPVADQITFACIRRYESRNQRVDGSGSQGWYQFTVSTWDLAKPYIAGLASTPNQASGNQQSEVAVWYFKRNGRFGVQWAADADRCPGKF